MSLYPQPEFSSGEFSLFEFALTGELISQSADLNASGAITVALVGAALAFSGFGASSVSAAQFSGQATGAAESVAVGASSSALSGLAFGFAEAASEGSSAVAVYGDSLSFASWAVPGLAVASFTVDVVAAAVADASSVCVADLHSSLFSLADASLQGTASASLASGTDAAGVMTSAGVSEAAFEYVSDPGFDTRCLSDALFSAASANYAAATSLSAATMYLDPDAVSHTLFTCVSGSSASVRAGSFWSGALASACSSTAHLNVHWAQSGGAVANAGAALTPVIVGVTNSAMSGTGSSVGSVLTQQVDTSVMTLVGQTVASVDSDYAAVAPSGMTTVGSTVFMGVGTSKQVNFSSMAAAGAAAFVGSSGVKTSSRFSGTGRALGTMNMGSPVYTSLLDASEYVMRPVEVRLAVREEIRSVVR